MFAQGVLRIFLALLLLTFLPGSLYADAIHLLSELNYFKVKSDSEDRQTQQTESSTTDRFKQTYRIDINKDLFPTLKTNSGVQVEMDNYKTNGDTGDTDNRNQQVLPYFDAEWRNSLYALSGGYQERYEKLSGSSFPETGRDYSKSYNLRGEWRPVDFPRVDASYIHTHRYDEPRTRDKETDIFLLNSRYEYENYEFLYNYLRNDDQNLFNDTSTLTTTHNGRVRYYQNYLDGRLSLNAGLRAEYSTQEFSGSGSRDFAVSPAGSGFFFIDDDANPGNIDPVFDYRPMTEAGDSLDLVNERFLDIGLDFGENVEANMLKLSLNGELDANSNISNSSNWKVYVSNDQDNWQPRVVTSIDYLRAENLLEIRFTPSAEHEYLLVVYSRPTPVEQISPVNVTFIRAFATRDLDDGSELTTHSYNGQLGLNWQASSKTKVIYSLNVQERDSSMFDDQRLRIDNGLNVVHLFNRIFTGTGRVSKSDLWEEWQHSSSIYSYSAKLTGHYLDTLNQSLIYSGSLNQDDDGDTLTNSIILRTNAELYRGWDVAFDQGYNWQSPAEGVDSSNFFIRIENSLAPHPNYNLIADYSINWEKKSGDDVVRSDTGRLRWFWVPRDTISIGGEVRLRRSDQGSTDVSWEYSASWLPLRDGTLQCSVSYSESQDMDDFRTRSYGPNLTWDVTPYATLSASYSQGYSESSTSTDNFENAQLNFRIYY